MEILNQDNGKKGRLYIEENGKTLAEMNYLWSGSSRIIIDHTEVSEELSGKGIGKKMVEKLVEMAREKHIKIMPLCPFAKNVFDKTDSFKDVLF